jgi:hypothetical protein
LSRLGASDIGGAKGKRQFHPRRGRVRELEAPPAALQSAEGWYTAALSALGFHAQSSAFKGSANGILSSCPLLI